MSGIFGLLVLVLDVLVIARVVTGNGTAEHKLLWTAVILLLPLLGLVLYVLLGDAPAHRRLSDGGRLERSELCGERFHS